MAGWLVTCPHVEKKLETVRHMLICAARTFLTYLSGVMSDWFVCTYGLIFVEWMDGLSDLFVCID